VAELEKNILESMDNIIKANEIAIQEIEKKMEDMIDSADDLLSEETQYMNFERIFSLNERFYTLLLTKKAEAAIAQASQESDYEVLDYPGVTGPPILPKVRKNYMLALVLGAGIPIGIIILLNYLNPYIITIEDLKKYSKIPLLGMIGHSRRESMLIVKTNPKALLAESFRKIRANLKYFSEGFNGGNTILITSSVSGEGKTFTSINLGYIYALSGKKTLLLGADMRKPAFDKFFELREEEGLSNYLAGVCNYDKLLHNVLLDDLFVIHSGTIPPNPSELLLGKRMNELMVRLKKDFDIIIIDSPPIGLVSDTIEMLKYSEVNLIIVRQNKTHKAALSGINNLYHEGKLGNCAVVYNDINYSRLSYSYNYGYGYGYSYGYGYGYGYSYGNSAGYYDEDHPEKKSFLKKLTRRNS
jgi:capsular exopolysaccharide synthesis family protein